MYDFHDPDADDTRGPKRVRPRPYQRAFRAMLAWLDLGQRGLGQTLVAMAVAAVIVAPAGAGGERLLALQVSTLDMARVSMAQGAPSQDVRDAQIAALEARIAALEALLAGGGAATGGTGQTTGQMGAAGPDRLARRPEPAAPEAITQALLAERALERTLVRTGALLLPPGASEIEPGLAYSRNESDLPTLVALNGETTVASLQTRRDDGRFTINGRIGLPYEAQIEAGIGVAAARQDERVVAVGARPLEASREGTAITDANLSIAKTLLKSDGRRPDLIGRVTWDSASGTDLDNGVGFANGFNEVSGSLVALARQDPLVFVGSVGYGATLETNGVKPGDQVSLGGAALLALSPETSMRIGVLTSFASETEVDGLGQIAGTDGQVAVLEIGYASVLSRRTYLDVGLEIGLTEDSPSFGISVSTPTRLPQAF